MSEKKAKAKRTENEKVSPEEARKILAEEEQNLSQAFITEYNALCQKHGIRVGVNTTLTLIPLEARKG